MAQLRRNDQPVERLAQLLADGVGRLRLLEQEAVEQRRHGGQLRAGSPVGQEDPEAGLGELGASLEVLDAVVAERPDEAAAERLGDAFALGVEGPQERVEVLARTVDPFLFTGCLLHRRAVSGQLGEVGEDGEDVELAPQQDRFARRGNRRGLLEAPDEVPRFARPDVVAHEEAAKVGEELLVRVARRRLAGEREDGLVGLILAAGDGHLETHQRRAGPHLDVAGDEHLGDAPGERRANRGLHLHALEDDDRVPGLDLVAGGDRDRDDERRGGRADEAALVTGDAVGDAVHLDELVGRVRREDDAVGRPADPEPLLEGAEVLEPDVERGFADPYPVALRTEPGDREAVRGASVAKLDHAVHVVRGGRPPAARGGVEALALDCLLRIVALDRRGQQRHLAVASGKQVVRRRQPVEPSRVGGAGEDLRPIHQVQQERPIGGASRHDDGRLHQRPAKTRAGLGPVGAPGHDLRDHRVVVGGDRVPLDEPGVDPDARPRREPQPL